MRWTPTFLLPLAATLAACQTDDPPPDEPAPCHVDEVPEAATLRWGWQTDGTFVSPGGRRVIPAGPTAVMTDLPIDLAVHPGGAWAYVALIDRDAGSLAVLDLDTLETIQLLQLPNTQFGLWVDPAGEALAAAGGALGAVMWFDIAGDGTLSAAGSTEVGGTPTGLALAPDGATLWTADAYEHRVTGVDVATREVTGSIELSCDGWDLVSVPGRDELYVGDLAGDAIAVVDLAAGEEVATLEVARSPAGLAASPDGTRVYAAVSNGDHLAVIDTAARAVVDQLAVTEGDWLDANGGALRNSNLTAVRLDPAGTRLYVARGTDNAVSVIDPSSGELLGSFPAAAYPLDLELAPDGRLVVAEYKGGGVQLGSATVVDVAALDLLETTDEVQELFASPQTQFPFECDGFFPIPSKEGQVTPIEHVVLIVKENKTLDCLFGDLGDELPLDVDPEYQRWPAELTPNQRALMKQFATSDNFYVNARESDSGHLFLTSTHLTHWVEWMWVETARNGGADTWPVQDPAIPTVGNFFVHLLDHGKTIRVYGEIVGMFEQAADGTQVMEYSDQDYPGGPFINYAVRDEDKALYFAERLADEGLADFTYLLLPNDHTQGTDPGFPTPESMVADNDRATGVVIEALSHSPLWESTVVFVLEDDPQGCDDHVNDSRSLLIVAGPYAKHGGYVSHTNADFLSVFATIERILGVPPLARPDAAATPLWDLFQPEPDPTPFVALDRVPEAFNDDRSPGAELSRRMDFSGPDRSPELEPLLDAYLLWRMGRISREEAERRLAAPNLAADAEEWEELEEEAQEERFAFDRDWARYEAWCAERGLPAPVRPGRRER